MSNVRAVRKRQQLNNLVAMVTELARPGYTVVDFCSGTVCCCRLRMYIYQHGTWTHLHETTALLFYKQTNKDHFIFLLDVLMAQVIALKMHRVVVLHRRRVGDSLERAALVMIFSDVPL